MAAVGNSDNNNNNNKDNNNNDYNNCSSSNNSYNTQWLIKDNVNNGLSEIIKLLKIRSHCGKEDNFSDDLR